MPVACSLQPAVHPRARAAYLVCILGLSQVADFRKCCRTPAESEKCRHIQCRWLCCFTKLHFRRWIAQFHCIWSLDSLIHTLPRGGAQGTLTKSIALIEVSFSPPLYKRPLDLFTYLHAHTFSSTCSALFKTDLPEGNKWDCPQVFCSMENDFI